MLIPTLAQITEDLTDRHLAVTTDAIATAFAQALGL